MEKYGILLIDDEPAYHAIVDAVLGPTGAAVVHADDSESAIQAVNTRAFDLILMDIQLGASDGYATAAAIRAAHPWAAACPVIAFTTLRPDQGERHFVDRGFDGWLPKPITSAELLAVARRWLRDDAIGVPQATGDDRLATLLGEAGARAMIERLHASLAEAVAAIDAGADPGPQGHSMGGLAGTLGFPALSAAWLSLQDSADAWPTVRAMTIEAIGRQDRASDG